MGGHDVRRARGRGNINIAGPRWVLDGFGGTLVFGKATAVVVWYLATSSCLCPARTKIFETRKSQCRVETACTLAFLRHIDEDLNCFTSSSSSLLVFGVHLLLPTSTPVKVAILSCPCLVVNKWNGTERNGTERNEPGVSAAACDGVLLLDCDGLEEGADPTATFKGTTAGQATAFSVRGGVACCLVNNVGKGGWEGGVWGGSKVLAPLEMWSVECEKAKRGVNSGTLSPKIMLV